MFGSATKQSWQSILKKPEVSMENEEYEVECIRKKRYRNDQVEYYVKYTGYDECESCWIPESDLDNAREAVATFERTSKRRREIENVPSADTSVPSAKLQRPLPTVPTTGFGSHRFKERKDFEVTKESTRQAQRNAVIPTAAQPAPLERLSNRDFGRPSKGHRNGRSVKESGFFPQVSITGQISAPLPASVPHSIAVVTNGQSGVEQGKLVVNIIAFKPAQLRIRSLNDVQYLINYADHPQDFVPHAVCIQHIPVHVAEYLAQTPIMWLQPD
ncbi:uncharacterized protein LOC129597471 [Paramacrobiotus metropolitanus]|uniref:uncharacterized protein LOC129597471 n=1 Tax=Paramacrobiotus metropolitanus TaxID=2943436 RepID=UPI002445B153|nr:uncharacterized protein LOC129597471 [Paramacrobiotus metropolitanus]